jgi:hypothetical protein
LHKGLDGLLVGWEIYLWGKTLHAMMEQIEPCGRMAQAKMLCLFDQVTMLDLI